ncbi:hypothetical protein [Sediminicola arcticus]|uniref:Uncharacterized protein n=1 Tax=Sediminicola arcticus TaxID=1574308 RepID=A0ABV2SPV3_9FLAO
MEQTISVKQILIDLLSIKDQVFKKYVGNVEYKDLLDFLMAKDYYNEEDLPLPTLKQIEAATGLRTYRIRRQLEIIYRELLNGSLEFNNVVISFNVEYHKTYGHFKCSRLIYLPRIGENMRLPFLKAKMGIDFFYVTDVRQTFEGETQFIEINLKGGFYNAYWHYRKHKALETGEIGLGEQYDLYEFQMKQRLGLRG